MKEQRKPVGRGPSHGSSGGDVGRVPSHGSAPTGRKKAIGHRSSAIPDSAKPPAALGHESQNISSPAVAKEMRELPSGWRWSRMSEVCSRVQDGTHFSPKEQTRTGDFKYITAKNIKRTGELTFPP